MALGEESDVATEDEQLMPGLSPNDPTTYDPTQGSGTPAWQEAVRKQREHNQRLGLERNAGFRRN